MGMKIKFQVISLLIAVLGAAALLATACDSNPSSPSSTAASPTVTSTHTSTPVSNTPTATITVSACASGGMFGDSAVGSAAVTYAGTTLVQKYTLSQSASVTQLAVDLTTPLVMSLGIYSNYSTGTYALNLIYASAPQTMSAGFNTVAVTPAVNLAAGTYWLACAVSGGSSIVLKAASGSTANVSWEGGGAFMPSSYLNLSGTPPIPTPPPTSTTNQGVIYAGYCY